MVDERFEYFKNAWDELEIGDKLSLYNSYRAESELGEEIFEFTEDFFENHYCVNAMEIIRATIYGNVDWADEYIYLDSLCNLQTLSTSSLDSYLDEFIIDIYEHNQFDYYIDMDDFYTDELKIEGDA